MSQHSQTPSTPARADMRGPRPPGEDPGTLMDEEYLTAGGPDALDSASPQSVEQRAEERIDAEVNEGYEVHPDSDVDNGREPRASNVEGNDPNEDPERIVRP